MAQKRLIRFIEEDPDGPFVPHNTRTNRCASTTNNDDATSERSIPISSSRSTVPRASSAWIELNTRYPVNDDRSAICVEGRSRISPTRITSGS